MVGKLVSSKPVIKKMGTIDCDMVETTPVVFHNRLYRFEYVRSNYKANRTGSSHFRFIDVGSGQHTRSFATGYHLGSAHVEAETVFVYGVDAWGGSELRVFWSNDLETWSSQTALNLPGWKIYNNSVCKGEDRYLMAFEIGAPPEETGVPFTIRFADSDDHLHWHLTPSECVFSKDRYTACPTLRFLDGYYYMIYLEAMPGPIYEPHIVRSQDLVHWQSSPLNPIMQFSAEDKAIAIPKLTASQRARITGAVNINNSDVDLCEFNGRTYIYYSWGNQKGTEFLAYAIYEGALDSFLRGYFPERRERS
ncbi:MAG: hypothetical protein DRQ02_11725 [Candidatus Latescibacterota bacterium]|nr:MAG: hypothetical protein DRQ02_11725 [Candidatus Latescibacterota bacterium]RKY71053.1 MAG: hypothetical protein DRQ24_08170 [Candidatus Latescibacterota bacterium]